MSIHEEEARIRAVVDEYPGLLWWIVRGERGMSSASLLYALTGVAISVALCDARRDDLPLDPGDLWRCIGLLDAVPKLRGLLPDLAAKGGQGWPALAARWAELEAMHKARDHAAIRRLLGLALRGAL